MFFPSLKWKDKQNIKLNSFQKVEKRALFFQRIVRCSYCMSLCLCLLKMLSAHSTDLAAGINQPALMLGVSNNPLLSKPVAHLCTRCASEKELYFLVLWY